MPKYDLTIGGHKYRITSEHELSDKELTEAGEGIAKQNSGSDRRSDQTETHPNQGRASNTGQSITMSPQARSGRIQSPSDKKRDSGKDTTKGAARSIGNRVEKKVQPKDGTTTSPLQQQAAAQLQQNIQANRAVRQASPNPLSTLHTLTQPLEQQLGRLGRWLTSQPFVPPMIPGSTVAGNKPPAVVHPTVSPLQQEMDRQASKLSFKDRLDAQDPAGALANSFPDTFRYLNSQQGRRDPQEGISKGIAKGALGFATVDNLALGGLLKAPALLGSAGKLVMSAASGAFGALAAKQAWESARKFKESGGKDYQEATEAGFDATIAAFAFKHSAEPGFEARKARLLAEHLYDRAEGDLRTHASKLRRGQEQVRKQGVTPGASERLARRHGIPYDLLQKELAKEYKRHGLTLTVPPPENKPLLKPNPSVVKVEERSKPAPKPKPIPPTKEQQAEIDRRTAARTPTKAPQRLAQPSETETRPEVPPAQNNATEPIVEETAKSEVEGQISPEKVTALSNIPVDDSYESQEYAKGMKEIAKAGIPLYKSIEDVPDKENLVYHGTWFSKLSDLLSSDVKGLLSLYPDAQTRHHGNVTFVYKPKGELGKELAVTDTQTTPAGRPIAAILNPAHHGKIDYQIRRLAEEAKPGEQAQTVQQSEATQKAQTGKSEDATPVVRKPSGLTPDATLFNTPPERMAGYGWRAMGAAEYQKLIAGTHSYIPEKSTGTSGHYIAPTPQSAGQYGGKGKYLVEFSGVGDTTNETISNPVGREHITAVWKHDGEGWVKQAKPSSRGSVPKPAQVQGKAEVKPSEPNTYDEYIDLSHEVESSHDKLSSRAKPHAGAANSELNRLEELGIDVSDSRDALEEYKGITRSEYPDAEEYRDARDSAWQDFLDAHQGLDATEVDNPDYDASSVPPVKPKPDKPVVKEPVVTASTPGAVTLSAAEANTVAMHLSEDHPLSDRFETADKPVLVSAEQAGHLRGILDKSGIKIDKSRLKGLYPEKPSAPAAKGKPAATKKPDKPLNIKARFGASHPTETVRAAEFAQKQGAVFTEGSFLGFSDRLEEAQKGKFGLAKTVAERKVIEEEVAKSKPADTKPPDRPSGGAPPPDAPIVGGAPEPQGGSGRPAPLSFNALKLPKFGTVKAKVSEWTRQLSNWFNRGSTGIERHARKTDDPTLLRAQRKQAGTKGQINAMLYHTIPLIRDAFKGSDAKMSQFFHYLAEGSLRGARQRWDDAHQQVLALDPAQLADPKIVGKYIDYLEKLEGRRRDEAAVDIDRDPDEELTTEDKIVDPANHDDRTHFAPGLARRARNLLTNGAYDEMRILMAGAFDEAYRTVGVMADFDPSRIGQGAEDFDAYGQKLDVQEAMKYYKEGIADPVTSAYEKNRGVKSDYLGPLETYFPLVPFREGGGTGHSVPAAPRAPFHNVPTAGAKFKTGLADQYDTSVQTIMDRMTYDLKRNNRGALVNTLRDMGLAVDLPHGTDPRKAPKTMMVNGEEVPAVVKPWKDSTKVVQNGKTYFTGGKNILVAKFAADEITPQLEHTEYEPGGPLSAITQAAITGPNAALIHNHNLASSLVSGTPFVGTSLGKIPGSIPGLKLATAIHQMMNIDPTSPERAADIRLLAEMGLFHPKSGTVTTSRAVSELHGVSPETGKPNVPVAPTSAMLYGMRGTELRTRLALMDVARATAAESGKVATQEDIFDFVSQAGIYAHGLDSVAERVLKKAQIAPFITAGKTQIGLGARALSGTTPLPRGIKPSAKVNLRARQLVSSGIVGATALWFATFKAYTGRLPDKDDKFNQIPVRPEHRSSKMGQVIFGPGDNPVSVSLDISNPALARGMHATGARSIINGVRAGDDPDKIISSSHKDVLNGLVSPVTTSPQLRFGTEAAAGVDPYLTSWKSKAGDFGMQFTPAVDEEPMGPHRLASQWINAALNLNPYTQLAGQMSGAPMIHRREDRKDDPAVTIALKTARDLFFPRAVPFQPPPGASVSKTPLQKEIDKMLPKRSSTSNPIRDAIRVR